MWRRLNKIRTLCVKSHLKRKIRIYFFPWMMLHCSQCYFSSMLFEWKGKIWFLFWEVLLDFLFYFIKIILLSGGYIDGKLLSKEDITNFSKLPDLEICQSETAGILSLISGGKTSSLFLSHIQTLSANMKQYEKQMKEQSDWLHTLISLK